MPDTMPKPGWPASRVVLLSLVAVAALGAAAMTVAVGLGLVWTRPRSAADPMAVGQAAYARGDWREASTSALKRLDEARGDEAALRLLARSSIRLGRDTSGLELYARLGAGAMQAEDFYLTGLALGRGGRPDPALVAWERALTLDPNHAETLEGLAQRYAQMNRLDRASELAARLAGRSGWQARGDLLLGVLRAQLNDPAGAAEALRRGLDLDPGANQGAPGSSPARFRKLLARSLLQVDRPTEARGQLQAVLAAGPDPEASWLLSRAALQQGATEEANSAQADAGPYRAEHPLEPEPGPYVGEARCAGCHRAAHQAMLASRHALSFSRGDQIATLPRPERPLPDPGDSKVSHALVKQGNQVVAETRLDGQTYRALVEYAFGTKDRYLTMVGRDDRGRYRALRLSYYEDETGSGWDLTSGDSVHPEAREGFLGKPIDTREGVIKCLACHTTNPRGGRDRVGPETADRGVGCESCHGPGGNHEKAVAARFSDPAIVNPTSAPAELVTQRLCGQCHSLNEPQMELATSRSDPIWLRSQSTTLAWSRCYNESSGGLSCLTCHDPHTKAETSPAYYEARCLACHAESASRQADATSHEGKPCPVNARNDCLKCHMPRVESRAVHARLTDHYIRVRRDEASGKPGS